MSLRRTVGIAGLLWVAAITLLHAWLNLGLGASAATTPSGREKFKVGFLPVTCHLTCPVTDFIDENLMGEGIFEPIRFSGWPEIKEAFLAGYMPATFMLAPLAMALREQGVPIKIVYLGHRDGTAMMVHKDSRNLPDRGPARQARRRLRRARLPDAHEDARRPCASGSASARRFSSSLTTSRRPCSWPTACW